MAKDPAFLFYSKDFYEGTRTMLPEERACYIDLMIYQHQNGAIPNDLKRIVMYCSGVSEAMLEATLEAKFKLINDVWINERLDQVISEREEFSNKQSVNGSVGQFWKKAKSILSKPNYSKLKDLLYEKSNNEVFELIKDKEISEAMLIAMLIALLKHLEDANANEDEDKDKDEFERFWNLYDKKVGDKKKLLTKWEKIRESDKVKIFETLPKYVNSTEKQFRKNPETYFNNHSWNDEIIKKTQNNDRHRQVSPIVGGEQGHTTL